MGPSPMALKAKIYIYGPNVMKFCKITNPAILQDYQSWLEQSSAKASCGTAPWAPAPWPVQEAAIIALRCLLVINLGVNLL